MDLEMISAMLNHASVMMMALTLLVFLTTAIVQTLKGVFRNLPTNLLVFIVAITLTVVVVFSLMAIYQIPFVWYYLTGSILLGFVVAYAAMYGFDKFKELYERLIALKDHRE